MLLKEQVAIVTGGGRGIGRAIARKFAEQGAAVVVTARTDSEILGVTAEIQNSGGKAAAIQADVSREAECEKIVRETHRIFGAVHILVNNAGVLGPVQPIERVEPREWDRVIAVNLSATFRLARAAVRGMMRRRFGRIIAITSVVGATGNPGQANYVAAKAGITGMIKSIAQEYAKRGVTANCVAPGFIVTPMTDKLNDKQREVILAKIPANRAGTVDEVAAAVAFLAANEAAYVTGQTLHVNGGMAMI